MRTFVRPPSGLNRGVLGMTPALVQGEGCTELPAGPYLMGVHGVPWGAELAVGLGRAWGSAPACAKPASKLALGLFLISSAVAEKGSCLQKGSSPKGTRDVISCFKGFFFPIF